MSLRTRALARAGVRARRVLAGPAARCQRLSCSRSASASLSFTVLATAWALFSGPTHYISLATRRVLRHRRLCGRRARRAVVPWPVVLLAAAARRACAVALVVGLSTLAAVRHLFRHLHFRPRRAHPPARDLVRGQRHRLGRPLSLPRHHAASRSTGSCSRWRPPCFVDRLADRPLAARPRAARDRRRRGGGAARRHRHHARQARAVRDQRRLHDR